MDQPRFLLVLSCCLVVTSTSRASDGVDYDRDVKPLLARHCVECHGAKVHKAKLRLDTAEFIRKGSSSGPVMVPGKSKDSPLIHALQGIEGATLMPFKKQALSAAQIRILTDWVDQGAIAPKNERADDGRSHWAFQPPKRAELPAVKDGQWTRNPIDRFILARLEKEGIRPSPEADRITLLRRAYLDLIGLPPGIDEMDAFLADTRPDAYERAVDHLLASPHYGERWGRHWLDLARYADSNGFTIDSSREIWKYRDWVIDALNKGMPFDQFVIEQMAGDMLPKATIEQKIATGFHRNTLVNEEGGVDQEQFRVDAVADRLNTTGTVFLGLTLGCARCHDHKYDPISQREYFQMFAFLNNQSEPTLSLADPAIVERREQVLGQLRKMEDALDKRYADYVQKLPASEKGGIDRAILLIQNLGNDQRDAKQKQTIAKYFLARIPAVKDDQDRVVALRKEVPKFPTTLVMQELPKARPTHIHLGGDFTRKGDPVSPGVPSVLHALPTGVRNQESGVRSQESGVRGQESGRGVNRLDFAHWLVDPRNPMLARVTMNRLWQQYFGKGLVETENDFGLQGSLPSHPELLDWLALEFMASRERQRPEESTHNNWNLKAMHRLIVTSATYRQSSRARPDLANVDPHNYLLARQGRLRLDAEIIRDNALAVSGLLSRKQGGPSVYPPQPKGVYQFTQVPRTWPTSAGADSYRRGVYTFFQRSAPYPALTVFDAPDGVTACTRRIRSNTPLQALTLLNDPAYVDLSRGLAVHLLRDGPAGERSRLQYAFRLCLGRPPSSAELGRLELYLAQQKQGFAGGKDAARLLGIGYEKIIGERDRIVELAAWTSMARVLLNLDEFITRE